MWSVGGSPVARLMGGMVASDFRGLGESVRWCPLGSVDFSGFLLCRFAGAFHFCTPLSRIVLEPPTDAGDGNFPCFAAFGVFLNRFNAGAFRVILNQFQPQFQNVFAFLIPCPVFFRFFLLVSVLVSAGVCILHRALPFDRRKFHLGVCKYFLDIERSQCVFQVGNVPPALQVLCPGGVSFAHAGCLAGSRFFSRCHRSNLFAVLARSQNRAISQAAK